MLVIVRASRYVARIPNARPATPEPRSAQSEANQMSNFSYEIRNNIAWVLFDSGGMNTLAKDAIAD